MSSVIAASCWSTVTVCSAPCRTPELRAGNLRFAAPFLLTPVIAIVILAKLMDFVVLAKFAISAIFPNVATAAIEERVVAPAIRELDTSEVSIIRHSGLGLKDWFQYDYRKKQSDDCEDGLRVKVNAHVSAS
jgi:hypothetical protein